MYYVTKICIFCCGARKKQWSMCFDVSEVNYAEWKIKLNIFWNFYMVQIILGYFIALQWYFK